MSNSFRRALCLVSVSALVILAAIATAWAQGSCGASIQSIMKLAVSDKPSEFLDDPAILEVFSIPDISTLSSSLNFCFFPEYGNFSLHIDRDDVTVSVRGGPTCDPGCILINHSTEPECVCPEPSGGPSVLFERPNLEVVDFFPDEEPRLRGFFRIKNFDVEKKILVILKK